MAGTIRLATYNVLCPEFAAPSLDGTDFYLRTRAFLPWAERWRRLVERVRGLDADVVCLQEVSKTHWDRSLRPAFEELGYRCLFAPRPAPRPDGVAVLVRAPLVAGPLETLGFPDDSAKVAGVVPVRLPGGRELLVVSAHLKWSADGNVPAAQLAHLFDAIDARAAALTVVAGDLNVDVLRHPVRAVVEARGYASAYPDDGRATWAAAGRAEKVDAVLVRGLRVVAVAPYPDLAPDPGLPSADEPSDHLPLVAQLA